ncbi:MAG: helix-turn-helix domain-containing protein [Candidatus Omnitrophota bacterium]
MENCIEHAVLLTHDDVIHGYSLPPTLQMPDRVDKASPGRFKQRIELIERDLIIDALKRSSGNVNAAAREMGITPRMVHYKIQKLGIDNQTYKIPQNK